MKNIISLIAVFSCALFMLLVSFFYYPKWEQAGTEATIGWDVSGYYFYLPAFFIYKDAKGLGFKDEVMEKYQPTPDLQQAYMHESGNYVMKYSIGQSFFFLPFFAAAHAYASASDLYPADGFSYPYQFMISMGSLVIAFLGLWCLRKALLYYFSDIVTAVALVLIVLATNYLDYAAINGAMTHNSLFLVYALLLYLSTKFYHRPSYIRALGIGILIGLAALTRPTEIISVLIPLLWGIGFPLKESISQRFRFIKNHFPKYLLAIIVVGVIGSIQLVYWKYATGNWIVYSYQDQGFSWLKPHLWKGIMGYRTGWLVYSPIMFAALLGFIPLYKKYNRVFWASFIFTVLFIYIAFAWDIWWYGGSLGQRAMVQAYPVLAFPLAATINFVSKRKVLLFIFAAFSALMIYYNLWLTHQAHKGGLLRVGEMTKAYFWKTVFRYEINENTLKLLDTDKEFTGIRQDVKVLYQNDFESDTTQAQCPMEPIEGQKSLCLNAHNQFSPIYFAELSQGDAEWVRASATFRSEFKEWNNWRSTQFSLRFYNGDAIVKERMIRLYRLLNDHETKSIFLDVKVPDEAYDKVGVFLWHADSDKNLMVDNLKIESFNEK